MKRYKLWIKLNSQQTFHVVIEAEDWTHCQQIAFATYGRENVLNWTQVG
jgi:hypothetical protein